ncbi:hypothetical protein [Amycolatopsis sp. NPDC004625]|uniref:hypothetical protein n=1 Tax=Amycolatopsis sp. NPDC004625 TaxID=3154670 RepID=UPI0033B4F57B
MPDWLPPREPGEPDGAARGAALLRARFARAVFATVPGLLVAAAWLFAGLTVPAAAALVLTGIPGYGAFVRHRQVLAARRTGWRTATVTLGAVASRRLPGTVAVRFSDGSRIDLRPVEGGHAVQALSELPGLPALVAGEGPAAMVVLVLPKPPVRDKAVLFGVRAETFRWLPGS